MDGSKLTKDEISKLDEGRRADALIATAVFGWKIEGRFTFPPPGDPRLSWCAMWDNEGRPHWMPNYSTDISQAWEVMQRMVIGTPRRPKLFFTAKKEWCCDMEFGAKAFAPTPALAICKAALLASVSGGL